MNKKFRIVLVIPDLKGNGAERVILNLAVGFAQKNCDVHIIIFNQFIDLKFDSNIKIHLFEKHYRWLPRSIRGRILAPLLDGFIIKNCGQPDIVLSNLLPVDRILACSNLNVFFVIHNTMSFETKSYNRDTNELISIYTKKPTICVSKGVMDDFKTTFITYSLKPTCFIYNPVHVKQIEQYSQLPSTLNINNYIIHVGKFDRAKRHDLLIKAYHKSGVDNHILLVGKGALENEIKELVKRLDIEDRVIFAGFQTNPYPLINNAKLMILCSDFEGLPGVVLESLTLDVPVISTNCPSGTSEILPEKNLCATGNIDELSRLIKKAIDNPLEYKHSLHNQFTLDFATTKYLELITPAFTHNV